MNPTQPELVFVAYEQSSSDMELCAVFECEEDAKRWVAEDRHGFRRYSKFQVIAKQDVES